MDLHAVGRRRFLLASGAGVLGVAVLGACSSGSSASSSASGGASGTGPSGSPGSLRWQRVSLSFVSAYLLVRGGRVAVVDTGTTGSAAAITAGLQAAGLGWDAVDHVVLTHRHPDHAGGLPGVEPLATRATIWAGPADVAAITSARPVRAVTPEDDVLGLRVVATPGHTPGHVSVFDSGTGVLVAGDALRTTDGLQGSDPQFTADAAAAAASVRALAALDVRVILPGHGDPLTSGAAQALRDLAARV